MSAKSNIMINETPPAGNIELSVVVRLKSNVIRTIRTIIFHTISRLKLDSIELKTYNLPRIRPEWRLAINW
jgi:hypothetical protein